MAALITELYILSLHDALPIFGSVDRRVVLGVSGHVIPIPEAVVIEQLSPRDDRADGHAERGLRAVHVRRSEEHTSELQSRQYLVCRLLLEKKKAATSA